ncbi:URC4/urg3 family protein [Ferrovibrio sp.]|uniref:URC4/urg3 family protein n=2 Tax=Ferrovibrio sp. TaxID=1917215 RepID=UPI003515C489
MGNLNDPAQAVAWLRTPEAIRARCHELLALGERDALPNFQVHFSRLPACADYVAQVIRENYPGLQIPYHARWRHFAAGGIDRWGRLAAELKDRDADEIARIRFDLCVASVLLDAGAGPDWAFSEDGTAIARSEGLAVASLHAFRAGLFSGDRKNLLRADAAGLAPLAPNAIAHAFQVSAANPLVGVEGRAALLRNLGAALAARPDLFGADARVGGLYDTLKKKVTDGKLPARAILAAVLEGFGPIWPSRMTLDGANLGDVWRHRGIVSGDLTSGLVPFHKLSQWLTYSLVEIFEDAGIAVTGLDDLTGLPEYRNGGLFIDLGVLSVRHDALKKFAIPVEDEAVVEWRALTLALLDRIADPVRERLGKTAAEMPLARILEGGTWAAGRKIAREKREGGGPPLTVVSDGTVF